MITNHAIVDITSDVDVNHTLVVGSSATRLRAAGHVGRERAEAEGGWEDERAGARHHLPHAVAAVVVPAGGEGPQWVFLMVFLWYFS